MSGLIDSVIDCSYIYSKNNNILSIFSLIKLRVRKNHQFFSYFNHIYIFKNIKIKIY